jgi:phospholipase/lecithinase/hemolysin
MPRCSAFHPTAWDVLEERVVASHGVAPRLTVGTLGDSYTDEYRFYPPDLSHARNWVEVLSATRKVDFGKFSPKSRGEPRDQGFAFNWARYGATSSDMIRNQLPGLAAQVAAGEVKYAWVFIGANDFLYFLRNIENGSIPLAAAPTMIAQIESQLAANFTTAVHTLLDASPNVKLVVVTLPDVSTLPIVQMALAIDPQAGPIVSDTSQAIAEYNDTIRSVAAGNSRIALVDLAGQATELAAFGSGSVRFGGTTIHLTTTADNYHNFFLADGLHIGTVGQALIANDFIMAIDADFGARVAPLIPRQIVAFARRVQATSSHGGGLP